MVVTTPNMGLHFYKNRFSEIFPKLLIRKSKGGARKQRKKSVDKPEPAPVSTYSSLPAWLEDLESLQHPSQEDIAFLSPVGRKRIQSGLFPATSTPVNLAILPLNKLEQRTH